MSTTTTSTRSCESYNSLADSDDDWCSVSADEIEDLEKSQASIIQKPSVPLQTIHSESIKKPAHHEKPIIAGSWTVVTLQSARDDCVHDMDRSDIELTPKKRLQIIAGASARLSVAPLQGLMARSRRQGDWTCFIITTTTTASHST
ncbi:hypothetical protein PspLS_08295 [Pyricularia sp. CBS 133598]|nr:hypothetical protein PspLS_08295 [Pyricularia sp. CBS 133598]